MRRLVAARYCLHPQLRQGTGVTLISTRWWPLLSWPQRHGRLFMGLIVSFAGAGVAWFRSTRFAGCRAPPARSG